EKQTYVSMFIEAGGNGGLISYDLELRLFRNFSLQAGFGGYSEDETPYGTLDSKVLIWIAHYLYGNEESHLDIGIGAVTLTYSNLCSDIAFPSSCHKFSGTAFIGYRYQSFSS